MTEGFSDPITAGDDLVIPAIRSPNYAAGLAGWSINLDGSAEFNNVVIRGGEVIDGTDLRYSPGPGAGNLVASLSAAGGTDQYGNVYLAGVVTYSGLVSAVQVFAQAVTWYAWNGSAWVAGPVAQLVFGGGLSIQGATSGTAASQSITLTPGTGGATITMAVPFSGTQYVFASQDTSGATDAATINAALGPGANVILAPGTYYVNAPIQVPVGCVLSGAGRGQVDADAMTVIKATAAMPAVICSSGWIAGTNTSTQGGIRISGLKVDANAKATHGVVIQNYSSLIEDVYVSGYSSCGIRFDAVSQSGLVTISGSGVNNQVVRCLAQGGVNPFLVHDPGGIFTDGYLLDSLLIDCTGSAVVIPKAVGWRIEGNHLYGLTTHGFTLSQLLMTRVTANYVESWGGSASAGTYLAIDAGFNGANSDEGSGSVIAGNTLNLLLSPGNAGSTLVGIGFACANNNTASVAVTGNVARCAPAAAAFAAAYAAWYGNQGAASVQLVATTGNQYPGNWTALNHTTPNGGTITVTAGS